MNRKSSRIARTISVQRIIGKHWCRGLGVPDNGGWPHTVDITEATSLALFRVMQTTSPVDGNIALVTIQSCGALHTAAGTDAAKLEETVENGAIVADIVFALLTHEAVHVIGRNFLQELNVLVGVKLCHFGSNGWFCALARESVVC